MNQRLKGALILAPFIIALFFGDIVRTFLLMVMGFLAYRELYTAFKQKDIHIPLALGIAIPIAIFILVLADDYELTITVLKALGIFTAILLLIQEEIKLKNIACSIGSVIYAFFPFLALTILGADYDGELYIIFVLLASFVTDICAMQAGKHFGKHKLTKISPNKTIEGSIGGVIGAMITCGIFGLLIGAPFLFMALIGGVCSIFAQLGDLFASAIKRYCGIKDFSNLIPGHGGILDRFDSVIFVSVAFFVIYLIMT